MRLEQLEYFVSAVSLQSLSAVSDAFFISPQVVSKAIKQLEEELHTTLFVRSRKGLLLTEKGKEIYRYAKEIVDDVQYLRKHYIDQSMSEEPFAGSVAIVTAKGLLPFFQNLIETTITQRFPKMELTLHTGHSYSIADGLSAETAYDLIGLVHPTEDWEQRLKHSVLEAYDVYLLKAEVLKLFMSRNSPFSRQKEISLKTLRSIPLIMYSLQPDTLFAHYLKTHYDIPLKYGMYMDNIAVCLDMIQEDRGYALGLDNIFFNSLSPEQRAKIVSIPLEIDYRYYCMMLVRKTRACDAAISAFTTVLIERLDAAKLS